MTKLFAGVTTAVVTAGAALVIATPASAAATVPADAITKDPNASNGTLSFYNSSGAQISSGNDLTHLFDYALASAPGRSGATKATLYLAFPDHTKNDSTTWFKSQKSLATTYPNSNAPTPLKNSANPLVSLKSTDGNLSSLLSTTDQDHTAGYDGIVQVRAYDTGAGAPFQTSPFWASDIYFDQAANTWQQVYPSVASASPTSTTLSASPMSPSTVGTNVTFTASVSGGVAGTVQFKDGSNDLGAVQTVNAGSASVSTSTLTAGTHTISAVFSPSDTTAYTGSTGSTSYTVNAAPATSTATTLTVTPDSPADNGTVETLTATVTPSDAAGTVTFKDGTTAIGNPVTVASGTASTTTTLGAGTHSLTAVFTPSNAGAYATSTSDVASYTVNPPASATTTSLAADLASPQLPSAQITFTATVAPASVAGNVEFRDGPTLLGTRTLAGGAASLKTALDKGSHQIIASFVPTDAKKAGASSSQALTYVVATAPAQPSDVNASAQNTTATVTWTAPTDNGGTPITGYDVQFSTDGVNWQTGAPQSRTSTATTQVVTGLSNGVGYQFRVRAINGVPTGTSSYTPTAAKVVPVADATSVGIGAPRSVRYAAPTTIALAVSNARDRSRVGGVPVSLYRRAAGQASYVRIVTVTTTAAGTAAYRTTLGSTSSFQWRFAGNARQKAAASAVATVSVAPVVSISGTPKKLKHGKKAKVYGVATPAPTGERVYLQRLLKGKWRTQATTTIKRQKLPNGRTRVGYVFSRTLSKKGSYVFRVTTAPTAYSVAGASGRLTVRAT